MKFRIASLLSLLSGIVFANSPVLSMDNLEISELPTKGAKLTASRSELTSDELASTSATYKHLRTIGNNASDEDLVGYILGKKWEQLSPEDQKNVVSKVTGKPIPTALDVLMRESNISEKYKQVRASGNEAPDEDLVAYLLGAEWNKLSPEDQASVVSKVTGKPYEEVKETVKSTTEIDAERETTSSISTLTDRTDVENGKSTFLDLMPRRDTTRVLSHLTSERPMREPGRRLPSRKNTLPLPSKHSDESTALSSPKVLDHSSEKEVAVTVKPVAEAPKQAPLKVFGGVQMPPIDFSTLKLRKVTKK